MAGRSHRVPQSVATSCEPSPPTMAGLPSERRPVGDLTHSVCLGSTCLRRLGGTGPASRGADSALAENSPPPGGERPRALRSGSDFPFLEERLPRWLCLGFSTLLRFLRLYNYYLIRGSGLNWLSRRIIVMQFPANRNFLCLTLGGCLPLCWTEAESRSCCSGLASHGLGDVLLHQHRVKGGGLQSSDTDGLSYLI